LGPYFDPKNLAWGEFALFLAPPRVENWILKVFGRLKPLEPLFNPFKE